MENECSFDGCHREVRSKGLCKTHYTQRTKGKPLTPIEPRGLPLTERFWPKVRKSDSCWNWTSTKFDSGYGAIKIAGKLKKAHRVAYELEVGPIPAGLQLDHTCRNHACVNPAHLRPATNKQNGEHRDANRGTSSGIRGVSWHKRHRKWIASVKADGKNHFCGYYNTPEEAGEAVKAKRLELFTHNNLDHQEN